MSYPTGPTVSAPLTNGSAQAAFGTHIDYLGVGGYRSVPTIADRDAIPTKPQLENDGLGSGMRRNYMIVAVQATNQLYILYIPTYPTLANDSTRLAALGDNSNWMKFTDFLALKGGGLTSDELDAVRAANYPSATNAFATLADLANLKPITPTYNPEVTASTGGMQTITLATPPEDILTIWLQEAASGGVRILYPIHYSYSGKTLTLTTDCGIDVGDKILVKYK